MLETPIESLPATSVVTFRKLKSLGIKSYWDLLNYFPSRYENYSLASSIGRLQPGETITVKGRVLEAKNEYTRRRFTLQKVKIEDASGALDLTWFNQPYLINLFKKAPYLAVSGIVKANNGKVSVEPKEYEVLSTLNQETHHTGRIVPIYPSTRGLSSRTLREKEYSVIKDVFVEVSADQGSAPEFLPVELVKKFNLLSESSAYQNIHFPQTLELATQARERLAFDELFILHLAMDITRREWEKEKVGHPLRVDEHQKEIDAFIKKLPFKLTGDQQKVIKVILKDLSRTRPMNRFLHGDVGSGKTVVAALAAYVTYLNGFTTLFMAPTEILAQQHYQTLQWLFENSKLKIGLQTGSKKMPKEEKFDLILGTHALLHQKHLSQKVGLVVIDEQHRFGVQQRAVLKTKGINPHLLTMTATPIPRTVALTFYGHLDVSTIEEMPKDRIQIKSFLVPKHKRDDGYKWIREKIKEGDQAFIICPLIEESDAETMKSVKAATKEYEHLAKEVFPDLKLGLLHGKMKAADKDKVMEDFKNKKYDILVSTPVVEVGIDIANATIMVIEAAERYGLAQLHQLRGRVGRGTKQSYCLLYTESTDKGILERLNFVAKNPSGLKIAEYDFAKRGPGEIYGIRQHGYLDLKIATLTDFPMIEKVKKAVEVFVDNFKLEDLPDIKKRIKEYNLSQISRD